MDKILVMFGSEEAGFTMLDIMLIEAVETAVNYQGEDYGHSMITLTNGNVYRVGQGIYSIQSKIREALR